MTILMLTIAYLLIGLICGLLNALLGFGGGFTIVPTMYWALTLMTSLPSGEIVKISIATSLVIMLFNSANACIRFYKGKKLTWRLGAPYILPIAIGSLLTLFAVEHLSGDTIKYLFELYILMSIVINLRKKFLKPKLADESPSTKISHIRRFLFGGFTGFSAALLGVGGSILTVPHFRKQGLTMNQAVPLATMLTIPVALFGLSAYIVAGFEANIALPFAIGYLYLPAALVIIIGANVGIHFGVRLAKIIPDSWYAKGYLLVLIVFLLVMLV